MSFRLLRYQSFNRDWKSIDIEFSSPNVLENELPFTTLLIGGNGVGKSYVLSCLLDDFRHIDNFIGSYKQISLFHHLKIPRSILTYSIAEDIYQVTIDVFDALHATKNNIEIQQHEILMPSKLLALAFMVNDKFPFYQNKEHLDDSKSIYQYLGARGASNATWTNTIGKTIAETIVVNATNPKFLERLANVLASMDFDSYVEIYFDFDRISPQKLDFIDHEYISSLIEKQNRSQFRTKIEFSDDEISKLLFFLKRIEKPVKNNKAIIYRIFSNQFSDVYALSQDYDILQKLNTLRILSYPKLTFFKDSSYDTGFDFDHASSGEKHILHSMVGLISKLEHTSLVLIDEPELSLHPNWQVKYIHNLKQVLSEYHTCHFILATHSHLMVSDLEPSSSSVVVLKETGDSEQKEIVAKPLEDTTYGWSAESILLDVFGMPSTRNYYLANEISEVLSIIADGTISVSKDTLVRVQKLEEISKSLKNIDPLKKIISAIVEAVQ